MITSLRCENFRCFRDTKTLELAPLTLLVGENNAGKSSLVQGLHLLAATYKAPDVRGSLRLLFEDHDYGGFEDLVFGHDEKKTFTLSFGATLATQVLVAEKPVRKSVDATLSFRFGYMPRRKEMYLEHFLLEDSKGPRLSIFPRPYTEWCKTLMRDDAGKLVPFPRLYYRRGLFFQPRLDPFETTGRLQKSYGKEKGSRLFNRILEDVQLLVKFGDSFQRVQCLGPLRARSARTHLYSGEITEWVGARGELASQNYAAIVRRAKKEDRARIASINRAFYRLGFVKKMGVRRMGARHYEFWTEHAKSSLSANLADTGFGASQVLPVIISLFASPSGSTLFYEQPEIHLHPAAQAELGSVLVSACSPRKTIIVETHSETLILRIQTEVAKRKLRPQDVAIYYVQPRKRGHRVIRIPMNQRGRFLRKWPRGFFEDSYRESLELSRARRRG